MEIAPTWPWRRAPRARQPGRVLLCRNRRLTARLWRHLFQVPAVHNEFGLRLCKRRAVKPYSDGFFLSGQKRKIVVAPENRNHVIAALAAREARVDHESDAVASVGERNGHPMLGSVDAH